jgi:hypothetical protein
MCLDLATGKKPESVVVVGYDENGIVFTLATPDLTPAEAYILLDRAKHIINYSDMMDGEDADDAG